MWAVRVRALVSFWASRHAPDSCAVGGRGSRRKSHTNATSLSKEPGIQRGGDTREDARARRGNKCSLVVLWRGRAAGLEHTLWAWESISIDWHNRLSRRAVRDPPPEGDERDHERTSVSSNFVRAHASPSAIERYWRRAGCPTMEDDVSRCWLVSHSLLESECEGGSVGRGRREREGGRERGGAHYLVMSAWPVPVRGRVGSGARAMYESRRGPVQGRERSRDLPV